ncbi:DUF3822 family protein [Pedobacter boryungensis]|uniref:DUF3822 family protein n=1 Tax=Pedobacter boryungensis TaxID=869962 RepID=A0ABX2DB47_9SPHI|nr:DUF3822 family protein [Pedobacter boryungensis]NQX31240.1 DUF3822 family protein [Pedobacter boryungensis]
MNNNNSILLIDPTFDPATASACNLLIKVGLDSFSYAILNKETNQVSAVFDEQECENGAQKFAERLKTDPYLTLPYQLVKVAVHTQNTIAVPNDLFNENSLTAHSQYFIEEPVGEIYTQTQSHFGFITIFALPKTTNELLTSFTEGRKCSHQAGLLALAEKLNGTVLILDFSVGSFNALYIQNQQVIFQQCYEIANLDEFNYYLLLMINQLSIDTKETNLQLAGIIHEGDDRYNCLLKYFSEVAFMATTTDLDQQVLEDMPAHYYSSLLALDQCV